MCDSCWRKEWLREAKYRVGYSCCPGQSDYLCSSCFRDKFHTPAGYPCFANLYHYQCLKRREWTGLRRDVFRKGAPPSTTGPTAPGGPSSSSASSTSRRGWTTTGTSATADGAGARDPKRARRCSPAADASSCTIAPWPVNPRTGSAPTNGSAPRDAGIALMAPSP